MKRRLVRIIVIVLSIVGLATALVMALLEYLQPHSPILPALGLVAAAITFVLGADGIIDRIRPTQRTDTIAAGEQAYLADRIQRFEAIIEDAGFVDLAGEEYNVARFEAMADQRHDNPGREYSAISAAASDHRQFVIIGDPGAGKTTTLQELALSAMRARCGKQRDALIRAVFGEQGIPLPLWIDLGRSDNPADVEDLFDYWWQHIWKLEGSVKAELQMGTVWLFLDGLNEMPERDVSRASRAEKLRDFLAEYPDIHVVATCRIADYQDDLNLGLPVVRVRSLDDIRWQAIAHKRLGAEKAGAFIETAAQKENDHLRRMARNPYTLSKLLYLFEQGRLPDDMPTLYRMFMAVRYEEYSVRSGMSFHYRWEKLESILQNFAFRLIARGFGTAVSERRARWMIGHRALQDSLGLGALLSDPISREISFDHQTLHQHFALPGLTERLSQGRTTRRVRFIRQIADLGEGGLPALPALREACNDPEIKISAMAWQSLGVMGADSRPGVGLREDNLPDIEWLPVKGGEIKITDQMFTVYPFHIAKYPITYAQFQAFIDAGEEGFYNPRWWERLAASDGHSSAPGDQYFKFANHPRERVSWYDAVAFCRWLNARLGYPDIPLNLKPETLKDFHGIRLPAEWEWQWAAQGGDGREHPYGNQFDASKGNTGETGISQTSAVGIFPQGAAPCGALDMSGNVWEWCLNEYSNPENTSLGGDEWRVVRGGSWLSSRVDARAACRSGFGPRARGSLDGFRVVCGRPPSR